jgi:Family of unknown function (DUF6493)
MGVDDHIGALVDLVRRPPDPASKAERNTAAQRAIEFFVDMPEAERRRLAPEIIRLHEDGWRQFGRWEPAAGDVLLDVRQTSLALVATATLAELKKIRSWVTSADACQVMIARQPDWLAEGLELMLDRTSSSFAIGEIAHAINRAVAQGMVLAPSHDRYAIGIAYGYEFGPQTGPLVERVRADVERLAPAIWRQFEVEGGGEISLAARDKYISAKAGGGDWAGTLKILSDEGWLDRQRLLDASLDALNRGFAQFRAGWFSRFHNLLAPTLDERVSRTERYFDLLASPIGPTVSLAMAALKAIQKAKRLDAGLVVERIAPALHASSAATALAALALLSEAAEARPKLCPAIIRLAAIGLEHPNSEVQETALQLIETHATALDEAMRVAIADRLGLIAAALQGRAQAVVSEKKGGLETQSGPHRDIAELKSRAAALPQDNMRRAGVDTALAALEAGSLDIPRAEFTGMDVPRLDPAKAVTPVASFEELIDEALVAVEHPDDLDHVERVLAAALAFAANRPANHARLLAPLVKSLTRFRDRGGIEWRTPRGALQIVLSAFYVEKPVEITAFQNDPRAAIILRTTAMAQAIWTRTPRQQLSTPTHTGHWIDPLVLVQRSAGAAPKNTPPLLGIADQVLALLRLAPDRRALALEAAQTVTEEWGMALRYALGGDEACGATKSLWVAASRARAPFDDDPRIARLMGRSQPGLDRAPQFSYTTSPREGGWLTLGLRGSDSGDAMNFGKEGMGGRARLAEAASPENCFPTNSMCDPAQLSHLDTYIPGDMRHTGSWVTAVWPQHPEPVFALSAKAACMLDGNNYVRPANEPLAHGLKLILDPDVPIGPMALLMLCRGLNAIDKAAAQGTVDALIACVEDGRLDGDTLGAAMHGFLMSGLVVAKRWPDRLKDVARSSPLALLVVRSALARALYDGTPTRELRDMHAWLETLLELAIEAGEAIEDPETRAGIRSYLDRGKARKLARALLDLEASKSRLVRTSAAVRALGSRIARAERWRTWEQ